MHEVKLIKIILCRVLFDDCAQLILSFLAILLCLSVGLDSAVLAVGGCSDLPPLADSSVTLCAI